MAGGSEPVDVVAVASAGRVVEVLAEHRAVAGSKAGLLLDPAV